METRWNQMKLDPIGLQCEIHHRWCSDFHCPTIYGSKAAPAPTPGSYLRGGTSQTSNAAQCHRSGQSIQSALASGNTGIIWHNLHSFQLFWVHFLHVVFMFSGPWYDTRWLAEEFPGNIWQRLCGFQTSCEKIKGPSPVELEKNKSTLWPLPKMSGCWGLVVVWSKESRSRLKTKQNMLSLYEGDFKKTESCCGHIGYSHSNGSRIAFISYVACGSGDVLIQS